MKSQRFHFYDKGQIAAITAENPAQPVVPDWYTYLVTASLSDAFPRWCAITIAPAETRQPPWCRINWSRATRPRGWLGRKST